MNPSQPTRHWQGFALSLFTSVLWGMLPLFLKLSVEAIAPITITVIRFFCAGLVVFAVLYRVRGLPDLKSFPRRIKQLIIAVSLLLAVNYVANVQGLDYLNPETAQVVMQLAPLMLILGGVCFYAEKLSKIEVLGAILLVVGLLLFFNERLIDLVNTRSQLGTGVLLIVLAALTWAAYALLQKPVLRYASAKQLTLFVYLIGTLVLLPFAQPIAMAQVQAIHWFALIFCCLNTILAYGAFTEALAVWQAAKVGAVISLAPIFTFLSMHFAVMWYPDYFSPSDINALGYFGAVIVVLGSVMASLGKQTRRS